MRRTSNPSNDIAKQLRQPSQLSWWASRVLAAAFLVTCFAACGNDEHDGGISSEQCRFDPASCPGEAGALCEDDRDCSAPLHCCTEQSNCAGGMCTVECRDDRDCPSDMACEHSICFYRCNDDRDCAVGMSCEHGSTICEWP
jgi:hypothetical protein